MSSAADIREDDKSSAIEFGHPWSAARCNDFFLSQRLFCHVSCATATRCTEWSWFEDRKNLGCEHAACSCYRPNPFKGLKTVMTMNVMGRRMMTTTVVTEVQQGTIPASTFEFPDGYTALSSR